MHTPPPTITPKARLKLTEDFLAVLIGVATHDTTEDGRPSYEELRHAILTDRPLAALMPAFVRDCRTAGEFWTFIKPRFAHYAERREFLREQFAPARAAMEDQLLYGAPADHAAGTVLRRLDAEHVHDAWQKAMERRATDPDGAITAARTLMEAVCKGILDRLAVPYEDQLELPKLYSLTAQQLNLAPSQHSEAIFRQILGGCQAVVEGIGAMRNRHSDAHGRGRSGVKPTPRHAHLAVNLAGTMATFLVETLEFRQQLPKEA